MSSLGYGAPTVWIDNWVAGASVQQLLAVVVVNRSFKKFGDLRLSMHCLVCGYTIERQLATVAVLISSIF